MIIDIPRQELEKRISQAFGSFPEILAAYVFGSVAEGRAHENSDVDIAVVVSRPLGLKKLDVLAALVDAGLDNVDLVTLDKDDVVLRFEALRPNWLVFARPDFDHGSYYSLVMREYFDFQPYLETQRAAYKRRLHGSA